VIVTEATFDLLVPGAGPAARQGAEKVPAEGAEAFKEINAMPIVWAEPEDISEAVISLVSDSGRDVTGTPSSASTLGRPRSKTSVSPSLRRSVSSERNVLDLPTPAASRRSLAGSGVLLIHSSRVGISLTLCQEAPAPRADTRPATTGHTGRSEGPGRSSAACGGVAAATRDVDVTAAKDESEESPPDRRGHLLREVEGATSTADTALPLFIETSQDAGVAASGVKQHARSCPPRSVAFLPS
jgi:hypothetical protein